MPQPGPGKVSTIPSTAVEGGGERLRLLSTKLFLPPARANRVQRPRLRQKLEAGLSGPLTLISAPAGFGKTTLLAECLADSAALGLGFCWLSLDETDNDVMRFLTYVVAACQTVQDGLGASVLVMLRSQPQPPLEVLLTGLINDIARAEPFVLVLDDYHVIHAPAIHQALDFLLEHMPPALRLVIATRSDPPLRLARLRARGQLLELRARDLRFGAGECAAFLNQTMGLSLSNDELATLEARTEGWIAALQLAALSLQGRADTREFINAFGGSQTYIVDYLLEEVLRRQPPDVQEFVLSTSILERLSGPLCDALSGRSDGRRMLDSLQQSNLFLIPLDDERRWYRYHHLFAAVLRGRVQLEQPAALPELHRRAGAWFAQHGFVAEALAHALAIKDWETMSGLIERHGERLVEVGDVTSLHRWLDALPPDVARAHPALSLLRAKLFALAHQLDRAEQALLEAERAAEPAQDAALLQEVAVRRVILALTSGDLPRTIQLAQAALSRLPTGQSRPRASLLLRLGVALAQTGDLSGALQALSESVRLSQEAGDSDTALQALDNQASVLHDQGKLREAAALYGQAVELVVGRGAGRNPSVIFALCDLCDCLYEWNDLAAAENRVREALERGAEGWQPRGMARAYTVLARVLLARRELSAAHAALENALLLIKQYNLPLFFTGATDACQVRLLLVEGNLAAASVWAQECGPGPDDPLTPLNESLYLAVARVRIAQGEARAVLPLLARLRDTAEAAGRSLAVVEVLVLEAVAHYDCGDVARARAVLLKVLARAEPEGYMRTFMDEGNTMWKLLSDYVGQAGVSPRTSGASTAMPAYANRLLAAFRSEAATPSPLTARMPAKSGFPFQALNARELEVLQLIAAGRSNREIAARLVVALSTVKWHINNLYGKLDVRSRTQALARARELGLL